MHRTQVFAVLALAFLSGVVPAAEAQTVTATIAVGASPGGLAVNPVTNKLYVVNDNTLMSRCSMGQRTGQRRFLWQVAHFS
jgi:DNA-binding beta-propeller fold protein YncE